MDRNELPLDPRHLGVSLVVSKIISEPMVHSAQTVHQYCVKINIVSKWVSKWTDMSFHFTHVT
jgi:hypothetical protein